MSLIRTSPSGPNVEVDAPVDLPPFSVYGNPTGALGPGTDIGLGPNTVLGRVAGNVIAAQLVSSQIALNQVTNALLAQSPALSVKANPSGALADVEDVVAAADDTVFRRVGGVLDFGPLTPAMFPAAFIPLSSIEAIAANTVVANATAGAASPTAVAIPPNAVLGRVAGNIVAALVVTAQIGLNQVTNAVLAQMDAQTVKVNASGAPADPQDLPVGMNSVLGRVGGNIIAAQIVTAQIALNQVDNAILAKMAANTVKVNATALLADAQDLAVGTNSVLGRVGGNVVAAQLVTAQIALNQVTNAVLAQGAALTVKANPTNALADFQDLAAGSNDTVLQRTGNALSFGQLTAGMFPAAIIPLSAIEQLTANTIVANATAGVASPTAVSVGLNTVVGRVAGNIVAAQLVTGQIALNQITNAVLAQMAALTVKANATNALANAADLAASSDDTVLRRTGSTLNFGQLTAGMFPAAIIPLTSLATQAANTVVANATAGVASPTAVAVGTNSVLGRVAGNIVAAQLVTAQIAVNQVTNAVLAQMAANTLKGNATAALADPQDISVGTNTVVGRVAGNIVAAQLVTAQIAVNQVTNAVLAQMAALTVKANATNALANAADLAAGSDDTVLRRTGSTLNFGQLTAGMFPAAIIPLTSLATQAANTVVANATAGTASPTAVAVGTNTVLGRVAGNIVAAQLVTAQITDNNVTLGKLATMAAGTTIGLQIDAAGPATPVALTGAEQGENIRFSTVVTDTTSSGTQATFTVADITTQVLINTAGTVEILGINIPTTNGQRVIFERQVGAVAAWTFRNNSGGAGVLQQRLLLDSGLDQILGDLQTIELEYTANRWRQVGGTASPLQAANTVLANDTAATAAMTAVSVGTNSVLGRVAGNIVAAQLVTAQIAVNQVTNAVLAQMAALTVKANATNALANAADLAAGSDDTVLRRTGSTLNFGQLTAGMFPAAIIPLTSLATQAANTVVANATAGTASPTAVSVGTNTVLGRVAGNIVAAQLVTGQITDANVTLAKLANLAAGTTIGRRIDDATGVPVALTGVEQGENLQIETGIVDNVTTGTQIAYAVPAPNNLLTFQNVTVRLEGVVARSGTHLWIRHTGSGSTTIVDEAAGAAVANRLSNGAGDITLINDQQALFLYQNGAWRCYGTSPRSPQAIQLDYTSVTGNLGTVDITGLECGGSLTFTSVADFQIEGFSVPQAEGFWFMLWFNGTDICTVFDEASAATSTSRIRMPGNGSQASPFVYAILYYRDSRWTWLSGGAPTAFGSITSLTTTTNSTSLRTVSTLRLPNGFLRSGSSIRCYLAVVTSRGATATATSCAMEFTISDGVSPVALASLTATINTVNASTGTGILEAIVTFHANPQAACPYTVSSKSSHTITSATVVNALAQPNLGLVYDTNLNLTFTLTCIMSVAVANVSMTPIAAFIEPVLRN